MTSNREIFGKTEKDEIVERVTISAGDLTAKVITWGAVIQDLRLEGHTPPLVLGFDNFDNYPKYSSYFGASPGRNANRIGNGHFNIDGKDYQLELNENGKTHLHGGSDGIAKRIWAIKSLSHNQVVLEILDPDGRAGYPGNCTVTATYTIYEAGTLSVIYESRSDAATIANVCQHSYFNLSGANDTLDHLITINADHYLPTNQYQVPTGEIKSVDNTPFDLRRMTLMNRRDNNEQVLYDHNFCLAPQRREKQHVARVYAPSSGLSLDVSTTEAGVQFYAAFKLNTPVPGLDGHNYGPFSGFCLETQIWPDAINHAHFPEAILRPETILRQETDYVFTKE